MRASVSICGMVLTLEVVTESLTYRREPVFPHFDKDARFNPDWWRRASPCSPVSYCRFVVDGEEIGRAKILLGSGVYAGYDTWFCPSGGVTEIDLIEIRPDLRRSGRHYGREAVGAIGQTYGHPVVAMSLDETSDRFWRSLGWTAHTHPDGVRYRTLFTSA